MKRLGNTILFLSYWIPDTETPIANNAIASFISVIPNSCLNCIQDKTIEWSSWGGDKLILSWNTSTTMMHPTTILISLVDSASSLQILITWLHIEHFTTVVAAAVTVASFFFTGLFFCGRLGWQPFLRHELLTFESGSQWSKTNQGIRSYAPSSKSSCVYQCIYFTLRMKHSSTWGMCRGNCTLLCRSAYLWMTPVISDHFLLIENIL